MTVSTRLPANIPKTLLVVPTYNEVENVGELIRRIRAISPEIDVLVVDDGSPDGTSKLVKTLSESDPHTHLLNRGAKLGLGTAYLDGFRWGMAKDFDYFFTMDADLSHKPEHLPNFLEILREKDMAIGARYIPGGGVKNWGFHRVLLSRGANTLARAALGLWDQHDLTSGYRGFRRPVVELLLKTDLKAEGYSFIVEVLHTVRKAGFAVGETPILFEDRQAGKSKLSGGIIGEGAKLLWRKFWQRMLGKG